VTTDTLDPIEQYCEACGTDTEWWHVDDGTDGPTCVRCGVREATER